MSPVSVVAPAKLNLSLAVGGPRLDGYHDLATVYHAVSLFDEIVATPGKGLSVTVEAGSGIDVDLTPRPVQARRGRRRAKGCPAHSGDS